MIALVLPAGIFAADTCIKRYIDKDFSFDREKYLFGKRILIHTIIKGGQNSPLFVLLFAFRCVIL